jgi:dihydrofolate reductase
MRRVRYGVAVSLDGYIASREGDADWIAMDPDIDFGALFNQFDTLIMGRRTFETVAATQGPSMPGMKVVVISRTLRQSDHPDVTISADPAAVLTELRARPGKDIWLFGGGSLFRSCLEAGLVDTVEVAVIPVLLGGGIPLLAPREQRSSLTLTRHRLYEKTGIMSLEYDVRRD